MFWLPALAQQLVNTLAVLGCEFFELFQPQLPLFGLGPKQVVVERLLTHELTTACFFKALLGRFIDFHLGHGWLFLFFGRFRTHEEGHPFPL